MLYWFPFIFSHSTFGFGCSMFDVHFFSMRHPFSPNNLHKRLPHEIYKNEERSSFHWGHYLICVICGLFFRPACHARHERAGNTHQTRPSPESAIQYHFNNPIQITIRHRRPGRQTKPPLKQILRYFTANHSGRICLFFYIILRLCAFA